MKRLIAWGGLAALLAGVVWYVYSDHYFAQRFDAAVDEIVKFGDEVKARFPSNSAAEHVRKTMSAVGEELKRYNKELNLKKLTRRERIEKLKNRFHETMAPYAIQSHNLPHHLKADDVEEIDSYMEGAEQPEKLIKILGIPTGSIDASPPKDNFIEKALEWIGFY